jgi:hypothetical protein
MNKPYIQFAGLAQSLAAASILLAGMITIIASNGGGDGGVDITDDPAPLMPSKVVYYIGGPGGDPATSGLTYTFDLATVSVALALEGSYAHATRAYTLNASPVGRMSITTSNLRFGLLLDPFAIRVEETLQWNYGEHPTAGKFSAVSGDFVSVTINNNVSGTGIAGVDVQYIGAQIVVDSASLTWAEFDAVLDDPLNEQAYLVQAAFTYLTIKTVYQHVQSIMDSFGIIRVQEATLEAAGSDNALSFSCDTLSNTTGSYQFVWHDAPGEIARALGSGDNLGWSFTDCWLHDSTLNAGLFYTSGDIAFNGYVESSNPFILGYDDVIVNDLAVTETEGAPGGVTLGTEMLINSFGSSGRGGSYVNLFPDTSGIINLVNVVRLAEVSAGAVTLPFEYGEFFMDLLENIAGEPASGSIPCGVSGSINYAIDPYPVTNGTTTNFTFNTCVEGNVADPVTITGSATLTINSVTGTVTSGSIYNVATTLAFNNVGILDDVGLVTVNGGMNFSRNANMGNFTETAADAAPQTLSVSEDGNDTNLTRFSVQATRTPGDITIGNTGNTIELEYSQVSDPLVISILSPLEGTGFPSMYTGSFKVTASDNTSLTVTISTDGDTTLAVDSDGDGSTDDTLMTNWDDIH